jgi:hypothetical protein
LIHADTLAGFKTQSGSIYTEFTPGF